jgi:hypothetical protein
LCQIRMPVPAAGIDLPAQFHGRRRRDRDLRVRDAFERIDDFLRRLTGR